MPEVNNNLPAICHVSRFYDGRSIFITGATGFMGKVLVYKLLSSCPGLRKIYVLIRPKWGVEVNKRLEEMLDSIVFNSIPKLKRKVIAVPGDITEPDLGLSQKDVSILAADVSVVFHSAATVKFNELLTRSVSMNVEGTRSVIQLARKMVNLKAFVHVSTAYAHCHRSFIEERLYDMDDTMPDAIIDMCKADNSKELNDNDVTRKIIGAHPNTYTFTKALAEELVKNEAGNLPVAIVRPSIVVASWKEPVSGWVNGITGATGIIAGVGTGVLRSLWADRNTVADIVPVDTVINFMCVVGWHVGTRSPLGAGIPVYNYTSGSTNPITWSQLEEYAYKFIYETPFDTMYWYPRGSFKKHKVHDRACKFFGHNLPAAVADIGLRVTGRKPTAGKLVEKMSKSIGVLEYFMIREWSWAGDNVAALKADLELAGGSSAENFNFDFSAMDWEGFMEGYVFGTRLFVVKDCPSTVMRARQKLAAFHALDCLLKALALAVLSYFFTIVVTALFY